MSIKKFENWSDSKGEKFKPSQNKILQKRDPMLKDEEINNILKSTLPSQWSGIRKGMELARDHYEKLISDGKLKIN